MPRPGKGARLYLRPARRDDAGGVRESAKWLIRDGGRDIGTGCGVDARAEAERRLAEYLTSKYAPERRERDISQISVSDVIAIYLTDVAPYQARPEKAGERAERLLRFFGRRRLDEITGALCREYVESRHGEGRSNKGRGGGARRDLEDLRAAINHHAREGLHRGLIRVALPPAGPARQRWLTRSEAARLVWTCLTTQEMQDGQPTNRRPLRHLARFVLCGVYTGSRPGAILGANWDRTIGRGWIDLDRGLFYRRPDDARETAKRQPPVPLAPPLWRLMRRWAREDGGRGPVVRFGGLPIQSVRTALKRAARLAGLDASVTAYTLRHTTGSWLIQAGVSTRKAAEILGTTEAMIERHYGHLAPDHLRAEVAMLGRR